MGKVLSLGVLAVALSASCCALASDWQVTYFGHPPGRLLIDRESIVDKGPVKQFWTLYAPLVEMGKPGLGYAYSKTMLQIHCAERTAATVATVFYDERELPHDSEVRDKSMRNIVPDSETDYLWNYVCKGDPNGKLATSAGSIKSFLTDQAKFTRENSMQIQRMQK